MPLSARTFRLAVPALCVAATRLLAGGVLAGCGLGASAQVIKVPSLSAEAVFSRADVNHDGRLTKAEAARYPAFAEKFEQLDVDHDGVLSLDEFTTGFNAPV